MNTMLSRILASTYRFSSGSSLAICITYILVVATIELLTPPRVNVALLYLLGVTFIGWRSGRVPVLVVSLLVTGLVTALDWLTNPAGPPTLVVLLWNTSTVFLVMTGTGLLAAEAARLANHLGSRVEERTKQWREEAEQHKATSARLAEVLERFEQVTNNITEVFWLSDVGKTDVIFVSPGYERIWGRKCADLYRNPQSWMDRIHPEDRERVRQKALTEQQGGLYDTEYRVVRPDGSVCWVHDRAFPVHNAAGEVYRIAGICREITQQKRAEFLLQAQRDVSTSLSLTSDLNSALKRLLEIAVRTEAVDCGGVYLLEPETGALRLATWLNLSEEFVRNVSYFPREAPRTQLVLAGKPIYALYEELGSTNEGESLRAIAVLPMVHEATVLGSINLGSRTHSEIPLETRRHIEAIAAQASGAVARLRAEEALQHSEARLRAIITGAPLIVFAADRDGVLTFMDGQALKVLDARPGANVGRPFAEVFSEFPAAPGYLQRVLSGEEFNSTFELGAFIFDCWFSPTRDRDGEVSGFIGVATNITERQRLQTQILEISDREQARIGQDIHDGLCQQLVSLAFDANSLESRLSAAGSPEAATAERLARQLDEAITESRQLSRGLFPIRLDAEGLPSALEELARSTQERHGLCCDFECTDPVVVTDNSVATHLYRIAQEAVTNVTKHSDAKSITLSLRFTPGQLELEIRDDGNGIVPQQERPTGGMGLHIMDYRARSIGGKLRLARCPQGGTVVSCILKA